MKLLWALGSLAVALGGLGGLWVMDIANTSVGVTNGFWEVPSDKAFHLALGAAIIAFIALMFSLIILLFRTEAPAAPPR